MTTPSTARKAGPFTGNGSQTAWPFTFKVFAAADVKVTATDANGDEVLLVLNTDYTVSLNANQETSPGGTVTYALASGRKLSIVGDLDYDQPLDLPSGGNYSPTALENQLDRTVMQIQQLREELDRAPKVPVTSTYPLESLTADLIRLADSADEIDAVAGSIANVNTVAADLNEPVSEINTVANNIANVNTVGNNIANVNTVAGISANVTTVAGIAANVTAVAGNATNINAVAGNATNINAVNANKTNIDAVAGNATNINTVAGNNANITTVAGISGNVTTVAGISADVQTVADNVADITNFADVYQGPKASDPTLRNNGSALQAGDLYFNTTDNALRAYSGTQWVAGTAGTVNVQRFSGTGAQTAFTLASAPAGENNTQVYIGGVYQQKDQYSLSGVTLTFSSAPPAGTDNIEVVTIATLALGQTNAALVDYVPAGTGAVATNVQSKLREVVSVKDFGAVGDGVTDDAAAVRRALDYASLNPCKIVFPAGTYYCPTTIFLPKGSGGFTLSGDNATLKGAGAGVGTIFETGAQTTSTGGTTNWEQPEVHLHRNQIIEGFTFADCEYGLKGYNLLEGCCFRNNKAIGSVRTIIYAKRCFYMAVMNNMHRGAPAGSSDNDARFWFSSFVNVEQISGNSASCTNQTAGNRGVGFRFDGGTSGLLANNNVAEACNKGLLIRGAVYGALFHGWYLEGNQRDVSIEDGNYKDGLSIDGCWFFSAEQVYAESWRSGELGKNNYFDTPATKTVNLINSLNSAHVWAPRDVDGTLTLYGKNILPAGWSINGSCIVNTQQSAYLAASGPSGARYALSSQFLGPNLIVPRYFRGRSNLRFSPVPYCDVNTSTFGTAVIDTKIVFDAFEAGLRFDFTVTDNTTTRRLSGWVSGTTVFRNDVLAQTIVASDNGGFYRLTLSGFSTASAISVYGGIRIL